MHTKFIPSKFSPKIGFVWAFGQHGNKTICALTPATINADGKAVTMFLRKGAKVAGYAAAKEWFSANIDAHHEKLESDIRKFYPHLI